MESLFQYSIYREIRLPIRLIFVLTWQRGYFFWGFLQVKGGNRYVFIANDDKIHTLGVFATIGKSLFGKENCFDKEKNKKKELSHYDSHLKKTIWYSSAYHLRIVFFCALFCSWFTNSSSSNKSIFSYIRRTVIISVFLIVYPCWYWCAYKRRNDKHYNQTMSASYYIGFCDS